MPKFTECPYCCSNDGYYIKTRISGNAEFRYGFNGEILEDGENSDIHDNLRYHEGKMAYCIDCRKFLFKLNND